MVGGIEIKATQPGWGLGLAELGNKHRFCADVAKQLGFSHS